MKKLILLLIAVLLTLPALTQAQNEKFMESTPAQRATLHTAWMQKNLALTADQLEKIKPMNLKYSLETEKLKSKELSKMEKFKMLKAIDKRRQTEFKYILTEKQLKIYNEKKKELLKMMRERKS